MRSIFDAARYEELLRRLDGMTPNDARRWGRMSLHQAVCHLSDSFKAVSALEAVRGLVS